MRWYYSRTYKKPFYIKAANTPPPQLSQRPFAKSVIIFIIPRTGIHPLKIFYTRANSAPAAINFFCVHFCKWHVSASSLCVRTKPPSAIFTMDILSNSLASFQFSRRCTSIQMLAHYLRWERERGGCHSENNLLMYLLFTAQRVAAGESINKRTLTHLLNAADTTHVTVFHTTHIIIICYSAPFVVYIAAAAAQRDG
jgi:hypothetical protein